MKETLISASQVAYIYDYEPLKALRLVCEANDVDLKTLVFVPDPKNDNKTIQLTGKKLPLATLTTVGKFDAKHNLDIEKCITSIRTGILKDKAAIDYLCKILVAKIKPRTKTGLYPEVIRIPIELRSLINDEEMYQKLIELVTSVIGNKLNPAKDETITIR